MKPQVYFVSDHDISTHTIDPDALYVLKKLHEAGFLAYLVGGGVRDLLLKRTPKDFDISTSALPEQIKYLFQRQCILIGRRFRLAHIRFGHKIIEVSTFRSGENESDLIVHDNQWGSPEEDVLRRDFTVNGLFYDPIEHSVIDYVGGWEDIRSNTLRSIGDAVVRFKQDPVRMIRLLKFRARFGCNIDTEARTALIHCREEILKSSSARILEEVLRMLESGAAAPFFNLLYESGLLKLLYPLLAQQWKQPLGKEILLHLTAMDKVNASAGKSPLDRPILMACLFFPMLRHNLQTKFLDKDIKPHMGDIIMLTASTLHEFDQDAFVHFPRRLTAITGNILCNQYRLLPLSGKKHPKVFRNKEFAAALLLLKVRALVDKSLIESYKTWKHMHRQHLHHSDHRHHHAPPHHTHTAS